MQGASPLASPATCTRAALARRALAVPAGGAQGDGCLLTLLPMSPAGACPVGRLLTLLSRQPQGACLLCRPPTPPLACFLSPSPCPFPPGKGEILVHFAGGSAPGTPVLNRLRHLQLLPSMSPVGVCLRNLQLGAKPTEPPFYWQCRQPRRGGTGGDGTIRRKRRRRLRWSSPGAGRAVPPGKAIPRRQKEISKNPIDKVGIMCYNGGAKRKTQGKAPADAPTTPTRRAERDTAQRNNGMENAKTSGTCMPITPPPQP